MQLGRIHVGPDGVWLIVAGAACLFMWWSTEPADWPARILLSLGMLSVVLGTVSVLTWAAISTYRFLRKRISS